MNVVLKSKKILKINNRYGILIFFSDNDAQLLLEHNSSVPKSSPIEMMKRRHASCDSVSSSHG
jgi:hypothetical protein